MLERLVQHVKALVSEAVCRNVGASDLLPGRDVIKNPDVLVSIENDEVGKRPACATVHLGVHGPQAPPSLVYLGEEW